MGPGSDSNPAGLDAVSPAAAAGSAARGQGQGQGQSPASAATPGRTVDEASQNQNQRQHGSSQANTSSHKRDAPAVDAPTPGTGGEDSSGPARKKKKTTGPGSRGVANLTPEQLAKKRANGMHFSAHCLICLWCHDKDGCVVHHSLHPLSCYKQYDCSCVQLLAYQHVAFFLPVLSNCRTHYPHPLVTPSREHHDTSQMS